MPIHHKHLCTESGIREKQGVDPTSLMLKAGDAGQCSSSSRQVCWVWLYFSFTSGHTCPKIQELKHSKVNSVSSSVHESPCCFLFISEKNGEVNCTLSWAYLWQEREISVHHLKARESLPVRGHTLWGGGREAEPCQRGEVICGSPVQQIQEIKTKIHINELTWIRTLWSKLLQ